MIQPYNLQRYLDAQENVYARAYSEIEHGHKQGHWMWFIFRQIIGLGQNETSKYYAIANLEEATMFLGHPILGSRLIAICEMLCKSKSNDALKTFDSPDDQKLF